ncbi:methylamine utilization protein [Reichenbachiella agarivorans]|uniref:Methylamine utilization protein n=1 Tax=Reichenbachiella agarivorans TaxID=2979464 RepID=A0ABY6CL18_9BACT|nr:cytochrome c peroxidase [Reichenbachiella agarivorans]UXP31211.1 methylamine utilization protein [Reichenbachiella agarivorans]
MRKETYWLVSLFFAFMSWSCQSNQTTHEKGDNPFDEVKAMFLVDMDSCLYYIDLVADSTSAEHVQEYFVRSRNYFKQMEPILSFAEVDNYSTLIQPNLLKVEEEDQTNIRIKEPQGYQVLEEMIFGEDEFSHAEVIQRALWIKNRLSLIRKNLFFDKYQTYHFLWLLRHGIIRTAFTGITGFDSPVLASSLNDAVITYGSLMSYMEIFESEFRDANLLDQWREEIKQSQKLLREGEFETFDRYDFIRNHTQHQIDLWNQTVTDWGVSFPFELAVKNDAKNLFSQQSFNVDYFSSRFSAPMDSQTVLLGKQLFVDTRLSKDGKMSCSSCHQADRAFTDGLPKSLGNLGKPVLRNSPTLMYAGFQHAFFYDLRAGNLEGQIVGVIQANDEFHSDLETMTQMVQSDSVYEPRFNAIYKTGVTEANIRNALANYIRSLAPFNSKFDQSMKKSEVILDDLEIKGFNLFMGKAACATCHFPPFFNGTVPPRYAESEMESLGVPSHANNREIDSDLGRYDVFRTEERKHFFKTPTIRNIALTAPYMHNGVYETLEEVMDFYNQGGGAGMGFDLPNQTLPFDSLSLDQSEIDAIVAFMRTLTDTREATY